MIFINNYLKLCYYLPLNIQNYVILYNPHDIKLFHKQVTSVLIGKKNRLI